MKPPDKQANLAALNLEQKNLTDLWRQASERKLKEAFDRTPPAQQFGGGSAETGRVEGAVGTRRRAQR